MTFLRWAYLALVSLGLCSCSDVTTGLSRVSYTLSLAGPGQGPISYRSRTGWDLVITEAKIAIGPVYLNVAPALDCPENARFLPKFPSLISTAYADEKDHRAGGRIVGQVLKRTVVDLLTPQKKMLGSGEGVSELVRSVEIWILPRGNEEGGGERIDPQKEAAALIVGTASKDGISLPFAAYLPLDSSMAGGQPLLDLRRVLRSHAEVPLQEGLALELLIDPRPWLMDADFSSLKDAPKEGGRHLVLADDPVMRTLKNGVLQSTPCPTSSLAPLITPVYTLRATGT